MNQNIGTAQVFVKIEGYETVAHTLGLIRNKLSQARSDLNRIHEIKNEEDNELKGWGASLDQIEKKVEDINRLLFQQSSS